ncbi:MAG: gamma carbonic anhydrase family protein [Chloroflexi bacterium]|nr:gamma carbonic anhydrase family protein [Chloroflexota bacterium]
MIRSFQGHTPNIHPSAFISEAAYVVGDVEIGENSSVWPGAVIRGDNAKIVIGKNSNIQDNSLVHSDQPARIGDGVTLGHGVVCHAKLVADNCLLGNGCTVNEGVEVGEFSIVASGAVLLEDTKIPDGSMVVGVPGKVRAQTAERHRELIKHVADSYVQHGRQYKDEGLQ